MELRAGWGAGGAGERRGGFGKLGILRGRNIPFPVMNLPGPAGLRVRTPSYSQAGTVSCAVSSLPQDQTAVQQTSNNLRTEVCR